MDIRTETVAITAFGETREVECHIYQDGNRISSVRWDVVVGRFPTGTKLHQTSLDLWKRHQERGGKVYTTSGPTAAVVDGDEYVLGTTLYIHNSNRGRIVAWNDEKWDPYRSQWR